MGLNLSLDSGGTKLAAVLYNEKYELVKYCSVGSVRSSTVERGTALARAGEIRDKLGIAGKTLDSVRGACEEYAVKEILRLSSAGKTAIAREADLGLDAAGITGDGLLAVTGTGATAFARKGDRMISAGGYGAAVSDEGSGYWIGREAFIAAIRDFEDRGERTALTDKIAEYLGYDRTRLREAVFSVYVRGKTPVSVVAGAVPAVKEAASEGDAAAVKILTEGGKIAALMMRSLIKQNGIDPELPLAVSGGVWKKNPLYFDSFARTVEESFPGKKIIIPAFEPVIGPVIRDAYEKYGAFGEKEAETFLRSFGECVYEFK